MPRKISPFGMFKDFYDGRYKQSASFRSREQAEKRAASLRKQGYVVKIDTHSDYALIMKEMPNSVFAKHATPENRTSYNVWYKVK